MKEYLLTQITNLILNPQITQAERTYFVRVKAEMETAGNPRALAQMIQRDLQTKTEQAPLSEAVQAFKIHLDEALKIKDDTPVKNQRAKNVALVAALLFTISQVIGFASLLSLLNGERDDVGYLLMFFGTILFSSIAVAFVELLLVWLAYAFINSRYGKGWAIFLIVIGVLTLLGSIGEMVTVIRLGNGLLDFAVALCLVAAGAIKLADSPTSK